MNIYSYKKRSKSKKGKGEEVIKKWQEEEVKE